ncbi:arylsulfatase [Hyphomonas sp.]|uniref:arylsulfatase n=1 Tax=Hyphomonas sp. TaxID=87 RepID=UPI0025B7CBAC|nr:arylsulfatase [Hyphomonas sp.]
MRKFLFLLRSLVCLVPLLAPLSAASEQPNIVVILVDDAGFMDFGGYGGEARTPNIEQLADAGVRFSNYHTSPLCSPSRAMLLTGLDSHRTGVGTIPEILRKEQRGSDAYSLHLLPGVETIAGRLKDAGYETFMTGKWHLGRGPGDLPDTHGFNRSFALDASGADNWEQKPFMPFYAEAPWYEDGKPARLPDDFYSSRFLVDQMIDYLGARDRDHPFFAYVAFQAIHIPVQAPKEFTDNYKGVYSGGWEALMQERFKRAKILGLVPEDAVPPALHPNLRKWESLTPDEQAHLERRMMVNAGMLEAMDFNIGRLIDYLKSTGDFDNTIFVVTSDNGPEFGDPTTDPVFRVWMSFNGYNDDFDTMGEKGSMAAIGPEWASAAAAPGSLFKMYASEGGTRVPLIVSGPGILPQGFNGALSFVTDIAPTLTEFAGIYGANMDGRSLVPVLSGQSAGVYNKEDPVGLEVGGNSALFKGEYKLTRNTLPHGDAEWRLHHLGSDPAEVRDLSADQPALREELIGDYARYAAALGVVDLPKDFDVKKQIGINARNMMLKRASPVLAGLLLVLIAGAAFLFLRQRRRRPG